jgi:hypothetical protein
MAQDAPKVNEIRVADVAGAVVVGKLVKIKKLGLVGVGVRPSRRAPIPDN